MAGVAGIQAGGTDPARTAAWGWDMTIQFNPRHLVSAHQVPFGLPLLTIGYCANLAAEERLRGLGVERIWRNGDGTDCLEDVIYDFRDRPGALAFVNETKLFGETNDEIAAVFDELERLEIKPIDIDFPGLRVPKLQERARKALHAAAPMPSHRIARRRGRQGGLAKAAAAELARSLRIAPDIARRLWKLEGVTQKQKLYVLGEGFTLSSCQRHFT